MRTRLLPAALLIALLAPVMALGDDAKNEAKLKARLEKLENENEKLRDELAKHKADTQKLFDAATRAEKSAGLDFRRPTAVAGPGAPATVPPVSQAPMKHATSRLKSARLEMTISFPAPRTVGVWRVHDMICDVKR